MSQVRGVWCSFMTAKLGTVRSSDQHLSPRSPQAVTVTTTTTPELRQLRYFVAVAEEGNLTRAARRLHIAQQSLSQQVRVLEAQLGAALFERSTRGVELTDVGAVLLREARPVLAQAERAVEAARRAASGEQGTLRVGFLSSVSNYLMPPVVRAFRARHPGIALHA